MARYEVTMTYTFVIETPNIQEAMAKHEFPTFEQGTIVSDPEFLDNLNHLVKLAD